MAVTNGAVSSRQARVYCAGALACISKHLTLRQFRQFALNAQSGARNPDAHVVMSCEKQAAHLLHG